MNEVWESPEKAQAFGEKLRPRLEEAGIQLSGEPVVFEVHALRHVLRPAVPPRHERGSWEEGRRAPETAAGLAAPSQRHVEPGASGQ
jgi:hypothetical protein